MARKNSRNTYSKRGRANPRALSFAGVWVLLGIFLGVGIMGGAYIVYKPAHLEGLSLLKQKKSGPIADRTERNPVKQRHNRPAGSDSKVKVQQFEFYTMLPKMEVELPPNTKDKATTAKPTPPTATAAPVVREPLEAPSTRIEALQPKTLALTTHATASTTAAKQTTVPLQKPGHSQYIVQAGIFQVLTEADTLKARLTLQGFAPQIQKVQTQDGHAWFRVTLGPFTSESLALNQKKRLEDQKVRGLLILQKANE